MTNELASSLIEIGLAYYTAGRPIPEHLAADLHDVARNDGIAMRLRADARRLLRLQPEAA